MIECRICLQIKQNLSSVFEQVLDVTYATMIESIAMVQIEETCNNMICFSCKNQVKNLYNFKKLIERSDLQLKHLIERCRFNNVNELLLNFCQNKIYTKNVCWNSENSNILNKINFDTKLNIISYKDVVITKIKKEVKTEVSNELAGDVLEDYVNFSSDEESQLNIKQYEKSNSTITKQRNNGINERVDKCEKVCIKPIYIDDLRLISNTSGSIRNKHNHTKQLKPKKELCPFCGILKANMKTHILVHTAERKHKCPKCNQRFYKESTLKGHIKKHSSEATIYKCDHCVGAFREKGSLVRHMLTHQNTMQFVCKLCSKSFKFKSGLVRHKLIHVGKSVVCDLCNMSFLDKYRLNRHMRVHTKERPYNCEICLQPYSYKRDFNRHCFKKHGVFLKCRSIRVMNLQVLEKEKVLTNELQNRVQNYVNAGQRLHSAVNPFEGPQAARAFKFAVQQLQINNQIPSNFCY